MLEELKENQTKSSQLQQESQQSRQNLINTFIQNHPDSTTNMQLKGYTLPRQQPLNWQIQCSFLDLHQVDPFAEVDMMPTHHLPAYNSALGMSFFPSVIVWAL